MKKIVTLLFCILLLFTLGVSFCVGAASDATVVYVKDGGTGDGSSAAKALSSLESAYAALDLSKDCTVVICGTFTQKSTFAYGTDYSGSVTITSVYGGTDYRTSGAKYQFNASNFACYGDTRFENLNFVSTAGGMVLVAQYNPVTVGKGVTMSGDKLTGGSMARSFTIVGGYDKNIGTPKTENTGDTNVTVLSGSQYYIVPFCRSIMGTYSGTANIKVGGTAEVSVLHGSATGATGIKLGNVKVEIADEAYVRTFYGATGVVSVNSYEFNWKSGTFNTLQWNCASTPAADLTVVGKKVLNATPSVQASASFGKIAPHFDSVSTLAEEAVVEDPNKLKNATLVYVMDGGAGNGATADAALSTLEDAYAALDLSKDCTIVICGAFTQTETFDYGIAYTGSVTITSVYGGTDYRASGAAYRFANANFVCSGDTRFENLNFTATGSYMYLVGQHNPITIGEGVTMTGDKLAGGSMGKSFTVIGGYHKSLGTPKSEDSSDTSITVLSGSKYYIIPFSNAGGVYSGTANIKIGGSASVSVLHGSATSAKGSQLGDVKIEITDNAQIRSLYGATAALYVNSYEITWKSGTIGELQWNCASTPAANLMVNGTKILRASDAVKTNTNYTTIAGLFDSVIGVNDTAETVTKVEAPTIRSDYGCARALYLLGLAQGYDTTGTNFGLNDKMTRAQMIVQVIRFLGVEAEVKAGSYKHPFTDVPSWADKYIGYAYTNGITSGVSAAKFNPDGETTEAQFLTALLRAIGYSDANGDFVWSNPYALAKKVGMKDRDSGGILFNRSDAFRFAWNTLYSTAKDGSLVKDKLIAAGVIAAADLDKAATECRDVFEPTNPQTATLDGDYYVLPISVYRDKTTAGFLGDVTGFMSGYEFVEWGDGSPRIAMPDDWFELCNGPYANKNPYKSNYDHLYYKADIDLWEAWIDDDYSIDILDQYILRDMYDAYGTFTSKVITDGWVKYDVYDLGGGSRTVGAYALMNKYGYLPEFAGRYEFGNYYSYCYEPCIGNETLGMSAAGMPETAIQMSEVFGSVTGDQENITWLKFLAAMYSLAYVESDIPTLIRTAQQIIPEDSYTYYVIDRCFELKEKYPDDWRAAVTEAESTHLLHKNLMDKDKTVDPNVNNSFVLLSLLYGEGDFTETCKIVSLSGYDGDSSGAIATGLIGLIVGMDGMPAEVNTFLWQDGRGVIINYHQQDNSSYWMYINGLPQRLRMTEIIDLYQKNFEDTLLENGGKIENGKYYIPKTTLGSADSVYFENFNDGDLSSYKTYGGKAELITEGYEGQYTAKISASESGESGMYTTISGLTVGAQYRVVGYVSTSAVTEAELFVRAAGKDVATATVYDTTKHIRRYFTFTATAETMELGVRIPDGGNTFKYATLDHVSVYRIAETSAADSVKITSTAKDGLYTGKINIAVTGKADKEVLLKVTFANTTGSTVRAAVTVNGDDFNTAPFYKTGTAVNVSSVDATYIPVLLTKEQNTITLDIGSSSLYISSVEIITSRELW